MKSAAARADAVIGTLFASWTSTCLCALLFVQAAAAQPSATESAQLARARQCFQDAQKSYAHGELKLALSGFRCAYDIAPSAELAWNLARVYERIGDADNGIRFYQLYLDVGKVTPSEAGTVRKRIAALEALKKRQADAIKNAGRGRDSLSGEARAFFQRGLALYRRGRYTEAAAAFGSALRASETPELHYDLAVTAEHLGKPRDAIDHFRAYLAARPAAADSGAVEARIAALQQKLP